MGVDARPEGPLASLGHVTKGELCREQALVFWCGRPSDTNPRAFSPVPLPLEVPGGAGNPPRAHRLTASADRLASLARLALPSERFGHRLHGELVSPANAVAVALVAPGAGELGLGHQGAANASGASSAIASAPPAASAPPDVGRWRSGSQVRYQGELLLTRQKTPSWQQVGRVRANARAQAGTSEAAGALT
jgi:hypothetical protein